MNAPSDNFEPLRKLLEIKRHEVPPPRYFETFSTRVIARLETAEAARNLSWWQRWGLAFDLKPAVVCGFAVVVCGVFSVGVIAGTQWKQPHQFAGPAMGVMAVSSWTVEPESAPSAPARIQGSTEPLLSHSDSPFNQFPVRATRASFPVQ